MFHLDEITARRAAADGGTVNFGGGLEKNRATFPGGAAYGEVEMMDLLSNPVQIPTHPQ